MNVNQFYYRLTQKWFGQLHFLRQKFPTCWLLLPGVGSYTFPTKKVVANKTDTEIALYSNLD